MPPHLSPRLSAARGTFTVVAMSEEPSHTDDMDSEPVEFDAVLRPHRSLGPRGFMVLMGFIGVVSFAAGVAFTLMGAWPVFGFFGLDVLAIYIAFRINFRAARLNERVQVSASRLRIRRTLPNGHSQVWQFNPYWAQIVATGADDDGVLVRSHGESVLLGRFLSPPEQQEFAVALQQALLRSRASHAQA